MTETWDDMAGIFSTIGLYEVGAEVEKKGMLRAQPRSTSQPGYS
jgi:hypothetical protein